MSPLARTPYVMILIKFYSAFTLILKQMTKGRYHSVSMMWIFMTFYSNAKYKCLLWKTICIASELRKQCYKHSGRYFILNTDSHIFQMFCAGCWTGYKICFGPAFASSVQTGAPIGPVGGGNSSPPRLQLPPPQGSVFPPQGFCLIGKSIQFRPPRPSCIWKIRYRNTAQHHFAGLHSRQATKAFWMFTQYLMVQRIKGLRKI